jgi:hypothetical protein
MHHDVMEKGVTIPTFDGELQDVTYQQPLIKTTK